jgi:hypothetical protein
MSTLSIDAEAVHLPTVSATVDTFGFAVRCDPDFDRIGAQVQISGYMTESETYRYQHKLPGGGFVGLGVGGRAWVEASMPKRIVHDDDTPNNDAGVSIADVLEIGREAYREATQLFNPTEHYESAKVVRLDLVRDFHGVTEQTAILDGLAAIPTTARSKVRRFADPTANRAETLRVGPKAWGCTLYDKHTESRGHAPEGQLRFEARLHQAQLTSVWASKLHGHVQVVADITQERCDAFQWGMFHRVAFDRAVPALGQISAAIWACEDLSPARRGAFWAYLTLPGFGSSLSAPTRRKYRDLAQSMGLAPGVGAPEQIGARVVRLDYYRGTQSVELAAAA